MPLTPNGNIYLAFASYQEKMDSRFRGNDG